ncbi:MAG: UDP-N-acetylmuramoyl-tripeptide--D-alanyl-D-alanine ligase [Pseudomonadota bacterium]
MIETPPLWTSTDAVAATDSTTTADWTATGVSIDSRETVPGDLFVALAGNARDGHAFVAQAFAKGAAAAMVTHRPEDVPADAPLLIVGDTLEGLRGLAAAARARTKARVVAVTGSVGKTSTKDMLALMLGAQGFCHAAVRSFNNHWGVPLTLARMPADADYAVLEIGMNHAGEIGPLSRLSRPHAAVITAVEAVHLEFFSGVEEIADAKAEIFEGLGPDGIAVLNTDIALYARLDAAAGPRPRVSFGSEGDVALRSTRISGAATVVEARIKGDPALFKIGAAGRHFAQNACGALAAVIALGADPARAMLALGQFEAPMGRGAREQVALGPGGIDGAIELIDESFNANPASMRAAFEVLANAPVEDDIGRIARGRRIAFLGDMLELGETERALHAALATAPEVAGIDLIHCCGPRMRALHAVLEPPRRGEWFEDSAAMAARAPRLVDAGDVVMVKGSKGSRMGPVLDAIRRLGKTRGEGGL